MCCRVGSLSRSMLLIQERREREKGGSFFLSLKEEVASAAGSILAGALIQHQLLFSVVCIGRANDVISTE